VPKMPIHRMVLGSVRLFMPAMLSYLSPKPREFLQDGLWRNDALWPLDKQEIREMRERRRRL
jgi:hypothetical protein